MLPNTVALAPSGAYAGQLAEPGMPNFARTFNCEGAGISAGMPVRRGTNAARQATLFDVGDTVDAQTFAGIVLLETSRAFEQAPPGDGDQVAILRLGSVYLNFAAAVTAGQAVSIDLSDVSLRGFDEGAALGANQHRLPGLRVAETTTGAGLAITEVALSSASDVNGAVTGDLAVTGDVAAVGGFRRSIMFTAPGALGVTAADQTNLDCRHSHTVTAYASGWIADRAGSIVGLSASLSAAITGASKTLTAKVTINGTEVGAALDCAFTTGGAETSKFATQAKDVTAFAAGDVIGVSYTSNTITNTPALVADIEVEC